MAGYNELDVLWGTNESVTSHTMLQDVKQVFSNNVFV
jgi:hypothetical protein